MCVCVCVCVCVVTLWRDCLLLEACDMTLSQYLFINHITEREASITPEVVRSCLAQFQHVNTLSFAGCAELALTSLDGAPRTLRGLNLSSVYTGDSTWVC